MDLEKAYNKIDNLCCINSIRDGYFDAYKETQDDDFCKDVPEMIEALETIKTVVDLQKEIGCPLDVLLKALKNGIWKEMYFREYKEPVLRHYDVIADKDVFTFEYLRHDIDGQDEIGEVRYKDYKKTWWLKSDRSE